MATLLRPSQKRRGGGLRRGHIKLRPNPCESRGPFGFIVGHCFFSRQRRCIRAFSLSENSAVMSVICVRGGGQTKAGGQSEKLPGR